jgi:acetyl-CoA synthetase
MEVVLSTVGDGNCPVVDTWWQTETGGIMITPLPGTTDLKPGSATLPFFGMDPLLGRRKWPRDSRQWSRADIFASSRPWPGMARTVWGDHKRFRQTYFAHYRGLYFTGDGCRRDEDGYYWITGRVDDVINVAGHQTWHGGNREFARGESLVSEAAVVGIPHEIKGTAIFAFVVPSVRRRKLLHTQRCSAR